ncbi:DUF4198 domain-containing protein [Gemmata sp. JC717]|uniref:DUF4198 domain-containing protein n=1 Tax=Gemmata algarum TaxID=2975278 RepID=A0ABU5EWI6_9BACT|nr:DUF4198 domain-containing protein [Gemmata algarum]MDY3553327.1 DUF4198 domain-containing protein [Gemmata algarum]MDY3558193.1 DUF4198 domain-containing protein [Gemmata algarum]
MPIRSFPRRPAIIAVAALLIASCGGPSRKPTYPTQGKLLINGQPAAGVTVFLHSLDATETEPTRPFATTKPDGTFSLTTTAADDGAPAGEYVVTLLYEPLESPLMRANKGKPPTFDKKYSDPKASPLRVTIQAKPSNELPPLEVK